MTNTTTILVSDFAEITVDLDNTLDSGKLFCVGVKLQEESSVLENMDSTATLWFDVLPSLAIDHNLDEHSFLYQFACLGLENILDSYGVESY